VVDVSDVEKKRNYEGAILKMKWLRKAVTYRVAVAQVTWFGSSRRVIKKDGVERKVHSMPLWKQSNRRPAKDSCVDDQIGQLTSKSAHDSRRGMAERQWR
jgi:hypothetical protein